MKSYLFLSMLLVLFGCGGKNYNDSEENSIDLEYGFNNPTNGDSSDFIKDPSVFALQTTPHSLLGPRSHVVYADASDIFIVSSDKIYRFDADGHFLNQVGIRGNGPYEHSNIYNVDVSPESREVYIYSGDNHMIVRDYSGEPVNDFHFSTSGILTFADVVGDRIVGEVRDYGKDGSLKVEMKWFGLNGEEISSIPLHEYPSHEVSYSGIPITYHYGSIIAYKDMFDRTSYLCTPDSINAHTVYNLGTLTPDRETLEDMDLRKSRAGRYAEIVDIQEDELNSYVLAVKGDLLYGFVVDKNSGKFHFSNKMDPPQRGGGIELEGLEEIKIWPSYVDRRFIKYSLVEIDPRDTLLLSEIKGNSVPFSREPNPVLITYR